MGRAAAPGRSSGKGGLGLELRRRSPLPLALSLARRRTASHFRRPPCPPRPLSTAKDEFAATWHLSETDVASGNKREYEYQAASSSEEEEEEAEGSGSRHLVEVRWTAGEEGFSGRRELLAALHPKSLVQRTFFPEGGRDVVTGDYWGFSYWTFVKSAVSASTSVLGTQGLLRAVGVGASASVGTSAAINWVLKDGLGRIGCMLFASVIGNKFDNDAKFFVFLGDLMYEVGVFLEIVSPLFASFFLVTASIANAFKSMSYMSRLPPRAAILKSFAVRENVGDVSAKANSQDVVAGLIGIGLGIGISFFVGSSVVKSLAVFLVSGALVWFSSLKALGNLRLNTLNRYRTEIILDNFVQHGSVLPLQDVNRREGALATLVKPFLNAEEEREFKTVFGASLKALQGQDRQRIGRLGEYLSFYEGEEYILVLSASRKMKSVRTLVFVNPEISARSTLLALLQAAYIKKRWRSLKSKGGLDSFDAMLETKAAYTLAKANFSKVTEGLRREGWVSKHVLWIPNSVLQFHKVSPDQGDGEESETLEDQANWKMRAKLTLTDLAKDPNCNSAVCEAPKIMEVSEDKM
ncbi:root UVB sensitive protein [Chloropicon primus]|nr:root UVB sensitive protein [Chloropicon primus]